MGKLLKEALVSCVSMMESKFPKGFNKDLTKPCIKHNLTSDIKEHQIIIYPETKNDYDDDNDDDDNVDLLGEEETKADERKYELEIPKE